MNSFLIILVFGWIIQCFSVSNLFNDSVDLRRKCGISENQLGNEVQRPFKVLISATDPYLHVLLNWLIYYIEICDDPSNIYLICLDEQIQQRVTDYGLSCSYFHLLPPGRGTYNRLWLIRTRITLSLLENGTDVLISDLDAIWLKNPFHEFRKHNSSVILASRAKFPEEVAERLGATICMGFIYIKSHAITIALWKQLTQTLGRTKGSDDQLSINQFLSRSDLDLPDRLKFYKSISPDLLTPKLNQQRFNITLLAQNEFRRSCDKNKPALVRQSTIAHCSTGQKSDSMKKTAVSTYGLWKLDDKNWKEMKIQKNQSLSSFFKTLSV
jgi:hypothetical protein